MGTRFRCQGVRKEVILMVQGLKVVQDSFLEADIVLWLDWLASLGEISAKGSNLENRGGWAEMVVER